MVPLQVHTDGQEIAAALGSCMSAPTSMAIQSSLQVGIQRRAARGEKVGGEKMVARFQIRDEGAREGGGGGGKTPKKKSTRIYKAAPQAVLIGSDNY